MGICEGGIPKVSGDLLIGAQIIDNGDVPEDELWFIYSEDGVLSNRHFVRETAGIIDRIIRHRAVIDAALGRLSLAE
jgi:hypothetical protein